MNWFLFPYVHCLDKFLIVPLAGSQLLKGKWRKGFEWESHWILVESIVCSEVPSFILASPLTPVYLAELTGVTEWFALWIGCCLLSLLNPFKLRKAEDSRGQDGPTVGAGLSGFGWCSQSLFCISRFFWGTDYLLSCRKGMNLNGGLVLIELPLRNSGCFVCSGAIWKCLCPCLWTEGKATQGNGKRPWEVFLCCSFPFLFLPWGRPLVLDLFTPRGSLGFSQQMPRPCQTPTSLPLCPVY